MIWNRPLSPKEIRDEYEKYYPPLPKNRQKTLAYIPGGKAINLDGKIMSEEWQDATLLPVISLMSKTQKSIDKFAYAAVKHDKQNIYIAFNVNGDYTKSEIVTHDNENIWKEDVVEFHYSDAKKQRYQFIVNTLGTIYDKKNLTDLSWNSKAKAKTFCYDGGWSTELVIPLNDIGGYTDEKVSGNFCVTRKAQKNIYTTWSKTVTDYCNQKYFGELYFDNQVDAVKINSVGSPSSGQINLCANTFPVSKGISVYAQLTDESNKVLKYPSNLANKNWQTRLESGVYNLKVTAKQNRKLIYRYLYDFQVNMPLEISFKCHARRGVIDIFTNLIGADSKVRAKLEAGKLKAIVDFCGKDGHAYVTKQFSISKLKENLQIPLKKNLKQGIYNIKVTIVGADSKLMRNINFRVPDMTPYKLKVAKDNTVPSPWLPVKKVAEKQYSILNREYIFKNSPFPEQIIFDDKNKLLALPPQFVIDCGNGPEKIKWLYFKQEKQYKDHINFSGKGTVSNLTFNWTGELWFDGMWKISVAMKPARNESNIKSFSLKWAVPSKYGKYLLTPLYTPWRNKKLQLSYNRIADFMIWTMGIRKGFAWWSRSKANWVNKKGEKQIILTRNDSTVNVCAKIITVPVKLNKTAVYTMAFTSSPAKSLPDKWRDFNIGQIWGAIPYETAKVQGYANRPGKLYPYTLQPWTGLIPYSAKAYQKNIDKLTKKNIKLCPYTMPVHTARIEESYDYFYPDWAQMPGYNWNAYDYNTGKTYFALACCGHTGAADLFAYRADKILRNFPQLYGLYYDICEGRACSNTSHGCGGVDAFGKKFSSSTLINMREVFIRARKITRRHKKKLILHAHSRFSPFTHIFGDYWWPGEQYGTKIKQNRKHFYCENIPLKEYQSGLSSHTHGVGVILMSQLDRYWLSAKGIPRLNARMFLTPCLLHDLNTSSVWINPKEIGKWWTNKHHVNLADAEFHGYWFDDAVKSSSSKVYVSWYSWKKPSPYSRLLVIGNIGRKSQKIALKINFEKLHLDPSNKSFINVETKEEISQDQLSKMRIKGNDFILIGIK